MKIYMSAAFFISAFFLSAGTLAEQSVSRTAVIAFGQDKPPFVFGQQQRGLEIDIVRESFAHKGIAVSVLHMPNNRLQMALLTMKNVDGAVTVRKKDDGTYYSDDFITFENHAITKKKSGIVISRISDLKNRSIVIWQKAYRDLGPEFERLFSPDPPYNSPFFNRSYLEIASQESQNRMFWKGNAEVIIVDRTIFEFYRKEFRKEIDTSEAVVYHNIFPALTHYQVSFRDKQLRDDFNEGLKYLRQTGRYRKLVERYSK